MLIRSQSKKTLTNLAQVTDLAVVEEEKEFGVIVYYPFSVFNEYSKMCLGTYSTEEKAIKVLDMIQNVYTQYGTIEDGLKNVYSAYNFPKVFVMPQDNEV